MGETTCHSKLAGIEPMNNFGLVQVEPASDGRGQSARLTIYKFEPNNGKAIPATVD